MDNQDDAKDKKLKPYRSPDLKRYQKPELQKFGDIKDVSKGNYAFAARENQIYTDFANS